MTSNYEIAFYTAGNRTGGYKVNATQAIDEFVGCVERYTKEAGFFVEVCDADCCAIVDLSTAGMTIKLIGVISDDMKEPLRLKLNDLLRH